MAAGWVSSALISLVAGGTWTQAAVDTRPAAAPARGAANVIVVLDSSGSMRDMPDSRDAGDVLALVDSPDEGEVTGDDPDSKLWQAKRVLAELVSTAPPGLRVHLGKYRQSATPADFGPDLRNRFLYATSDPRAAGLLVNPGADGSAAPGLKRSARDWRTFGGVKSYYVVAGRFWNGERVQVLPDGSQARIVARGAPSNPPFVDVQTRPAAGEAAAAPVRFVFKGIRWNKANRRENPANRAAVLIDNASCGGFAPVTSDAAAIGRYLGPEVGIGPDGSIDGYADGSPGAPPVAAPREHGIRASGLTPLAGTLIDIRTLLAGAWNGLRSEKTFVVLLTDGDDTCADRKTGDVNLAAADGRALRAAHKAQLLLEELAVPVIVVTFGTDVSLRRSHWIAWGGSGMAQASSGVGEGARWTSPPTDAERAACRSCLDALAARDAVELSAAIHKAIGMGLEWAGK